MPITDNQPMSEIKLPSEVIEQIKYCSPTLYRNGMLRGAKIAATHYEQENKRLVELLKKSLVVNYVLDGSIERIEGGATEYAKQYCKSNGIKGE